MDTMDQFVGTFAKNADMMTRMWTDLASKMMMAGATFQPGTPPPDAARQMRGTMFKAMAESCEDFMRTPQFLEMMKLCMDSSLQIRKEVNDFLTNAHHNLQTPAKGDIDSLMLTIRHMETRILDRMEDLSSRLEDFDDQLVALNRRLDALNQDKTAESTSRRKAPEPESVHSQQAVRKRFKR